LRIGPSNANQLALTLNLNYRTIQHHLDIMMEHNLIRVVKKGGYGDMYNLDPELAFADVVVKEIIANAQRKELFKDLAGSVDLDRNGVDPTTVGFLLIDSGGRIILSNQGIKKITGGQQPLKGEMAEKYFNPSLKDALLKMDHDKGTNTNIRTMLHRSDGSDIFVSVNVDLIDCEEFPKGYSLVISEDIDPPQNGDQKYEPTLKDRYDDLLAMVPVGIIIIEGAQGTVRFINSTAEEMFGKGMMDTQFIGQSEKYRILQNSGRPYVTRDLPLFRATMERGCTSYPLVHR
jgi:PAS domain S-box-containing protein